MTGRYITRGAGKLVRVRLEDGSDLVGTAQHPIWSESRRAWTPLGELLPGEHLRGRAGPLAVLAATPLPGVADVYNLEIHGQHVYAITPAGVLVHNATGDRCGDFARPANTTARSPSGRYTEPSLPDRTIVKDRGVEVRHYTRGNDHPPAHAHVYGEGPDTRIGANGRTLPGDAPLSAAQKRVIEDHLPEIRSAINKIRRWWKWQFHLFDK